MPERSLLVVDDNQQVIRVLLRNVRAKLQGEFRDIHVAYNAREAVKILSNEHITHVICDWDLGDGGIKGNYLVYGWRLSFKDIQRAIVFTGADLNQVEKLEGVDGIVSKGCEFEKLYTSLLGDQPTAEDEAGRVSRPA